MDGFKSKSYSSKSTNGTAEMDDLKCYSASYANSNKEMKLKKAKSTNGSSSFRRIWSMSDPELQRMKRVAGYKAYDVEGKMKGSIRRSFKWIKDKCNRVIHGWN
ncbi:hypothetical protein LUZ60_012319 [Juncus effusus]|nr:hypothetical protein LUZ60_012319 [Juncus effusus]